MSTKDKVGDTIQLYFAAAVYKKWKDATIRRFDTLLTTATTKFNFSHSQRCGQFIEATTRDGITHRAPLNNISTAATIITVPDQY